MYRKQHKKEIAADAGKKKRSALKSYRRGGLKSRKFEMLLVRPHFVKFRRGSRRSKMNRRPRKLNWWPSQRLKARVACPRPRAMVPLKGQIIAWMLINFIFT